MALLAFPGLLIALLHAKAWHGFLKDTVGKLARRGKIKGGGKEVFEKSISVADASRNGADRQAAQALRMRLDWKYALHLSLEDSGFDFSVLSEFRDRLIEGKAEQRVFEELVEEIRGMGLIKEHGKQRTDSIAMFTKVRRLCRVETVVETLRLAIVAIVDTDREWSEEMIPPSWEAKYGERFVRQRYSEKEWKEYEEKIGEEGQWLLKRLETGGAPAELQHLPEVQVLKTVWAQQFREEGGKMAYTDLKNMMVTPQSKVRMTQKLAIAANATLSGWATRCKLRKRRLKAILLSSQILWEQVAIGRIGKNCLPFKNGLLQERAPLQNTMWRQVT